MINQNDRRKLRETIAALKAKTTGNGCTEAEALAAAEKVAELLSQHGVSDADALEFDEAKVEIGRRTVVDNLWGQVATFCHCRHWYVGDGRRWALVYFGRWNDVAVADYLHALLERHIKAATREWQKTKDYTRRRSPRTKREATKAFQEGLIRALSNKLWAIQWRRTPKVEGANHQALVLSPLSAVDDALAKKNIAFDTKPLKPVKGAHKSFDNEKGAGIAAASGIDINAAMTATRPAVAGLLT